MDLESGENSEASERSIANENEARIIGNTVTENELILRNIAEEKQAIVNCIKKLSKILRRSHACGRQICLERSLLLILIHRVQHSNPNQLSVLHNRLFPVLKQYNLEV